MKKRILSTFLSLVLCLSLIPTAAFAEGAEGGNAAQPSDTDSNDYYTIGTPEDDVAAVQALIDALPTVDTVTADDYDAVQDAYDAYDALSEEQQAQITGAEVFEALFAWFNGQTTLIDGSITYIGADGNAATATNCTVLDSDYVSNHTNTISAGWYVVSEDVTISGTVTVTGDVNLILCDGATLNVTGGLKGESDAALHIYGQSEGENVGVMNVSGVASGNNNYAINMDGGELEINSGKVTATGGTAAAGGSYGICETGRLTVNGGELTATGGAAEYSYGIFCMQNTCDITVTGGTLKATGGTANESYGIYLPSGGNFTVSGGGELTAEGGTVTSTAYSGYSVGIHSSASGSYSITVKDGGTLTAAGKAVSNANSAFSIGIDLTNYAITVQNGGKLTATGGGSTGSYEAESYGIFCKTLTIKDAGTTVTAKGGTARAYSSANSCGIYTKNGGVTISGGTVTAYSGMATASITLEAYSCGICAGSFTSSVESGKIIIEQTEGKITTLYGKDNGPVSLSAYSLTYNGGKLTLARDSTFTKSLSSSDDDMSFLPILPTGYAFALRTTDGEAENEISPKVCNVENGTIVLKLCDHMDGDTSARENGICKYCGGAGVLVKSSTGDTVYESFTLAYNAAKNGDTITLLADTVRVLSEEGDKIEKNITLDLNGHDFSSTLNGSAEATQIRGNVTIQGSSGTLASLDVCMDGEVTLDGGITVSKAVAESRKLIVKNGVTVTDLEARPGSSLQLSGGTFGTITRGALIGLNSSADYSQTPTFAQMLAEDCGFYQTGEGGKTWLSPNENTTSLTNVSVAKVPIKSVSLTASSNSVTYATLVNLTATVEQNGSDQIVYKWQEKTGETWSELSDTTATYKVYPTVGTHTYRCAAAADGYTAISNDLTVTVTKGTVETNGPTANTGLIYNAQEQALVGAPVTLPTGTTMQYRLSPTDEWSNTIPKAKNADTYTVYWQVLGGDNYNDLTNTTPVTVTIEPNNIGNSMQMAIVNFSVPSLTYNGQPQTPSPVLKLQSKGDGGTAVVVYETLVEDTDYTVTVEPQTDAGSYSLTITGKGNYTGTMNTSWSIERADYTGTTTANGSAKYGTTGTVELSDLIMSGGTAAASIQTDANSILNGAPDMSGTTLQFAFVNNSAKIDETAEIKVSVTDCTNYNDYTITVTVTVTDRDVPTVTANDINVTYTGSEIPASAITGTATFNGRTVAGSWSFTNGDTFTTVANSSDSVSVTFTPTDTANFATATAIIKVTIAKVTPTGEPKYTAITASGKKLSDANLTTVDGTFSVAGSVKWVDAEGNDLADTTEVAANTAYKWLFTPTDSGNYNILTSSITLWHRSSGGSSGGSSTSTTTKNPDGSTTTTTTDKKTGEVTETTKNANGVTGTTVTDKDGNVTDISANIPASATKDGETVALPINEVKPENGTTIDVNVPAGGATIEVPVKDPTPGTVIVIVDKDGTETVIPGSKVTENGIEVKLTEDATIKVIDNSKSFDDVKPGDYFSKPVQWASARNITGGTSATTFGPHDSCTRAQLVTFLYRYAQSQNSGFTGAWMFQLPFSDVPEWCYESVAWCYMNNIVGGYGNGLFGSNDTITREQMAVILYRFAQKTGLDTTQGGMAVREYSDYESISDYAVTAMQWAVNAGILQGYNNHLMPGQPCTRAQIVTMLYRLLGT